MGSNESDVGKRKITIADFAAQNSSKIQIATGAVALALKSGPFCRQRCQSDGNRKVIMNVF
jgi:hypothetical protein